MKWNYKNQWKLFQWRAHWPVSLNLGASKCNFAYHVSRNNANGKFPAEICGKLQKKYLIICIFQKINKNSPPENLRLERSIETVKLVVFCLCLLRLNRKGKRTDWSPVWQLTEQVDQTCHFKVSLWRGI